MFDSQPEVIFEQETLFTLLQSTQLLNGDLMLSPSSCNINAYLIITGEVNVELKPSCAYHKIDTFRGEQRKVYEECIVSIAALQKAPLGLK